jgi:hypothetical protein
MSRGEANYIHKILPRFGLCSLVSTIDNIEQRNKSTTDLEIWFPKLSKSEQNAYNKDISRLRSIVKPKTRSTNHVSIGEIHALIRNSHTIRRRMLYQKQDIDFSMKVLEYQEIFHEEAVRKIFFLYYSFYRGLIIFYPCFVHLLSHIVA